MSDRCVQIQVDASFEADIRGEARPGTQDRTRSDRAASTDRGGRVNEGHSTETGRGQSLVDHPTDATVPDTDDESPPPWIGVGRRTEVGEPESAQQFVIDVAVVDETQQIDTGVEFVQCVDDVDAFPAEATGADDHQWAGFWRDAHVRNVLSQIVASRWIGSGTLKRLFDVVIAGGALVALSPVTAIVALVVRVRLGSPVIFRQARAGRHGASIDVPKFRSMTDERDADGELLPDAVRLTPFGSKLRATSLDELPQLWTIVKGDMSLIGPRPLPVAYRDRYDERQRRRLDARPGLTGWAQVHGRNTVDWAERFELDVWYVDHASIRLDLSIIRRTVAMVLRRDGVSADGEATMSEFMGSSTPNSTDGQDVRE